MDAMFGLSMNTIMIVLLAALALAASAVMLIFLRNRIIFMMGLRNIPRRRAQTILIVIGLMLSTVIITAAFTTGDTVDYSITRQTYDQLGHADIILDGEVGGRQPSAGTDEVNISGSEYQAFLDAADAADLEHVDGYAGLLIEVVPAISRASNLSEPDIAFNGVDASRMEAFPDIVDAASGEALSVSDLGPSEVYANVSAADELDLRAGDVIDVFVNGEPRAYTVRAVVKDTGMAGAIDFESPEGLVAPLEEVQALAGEDGVTLIVISVQGGVRDTLPLIPAVEEQINALIADNDLRIEVSDSKVEIIREAEEIGNFMTTFFLLLGLFSIGAGMLLIVMIFVMLAAERKSEMGMARAVGTKRRHLVEMFLAEGTAYNLMAAIVGVALGIIFAFALATAASSLFSAFGIKFVPHVTLRTAVVSFSLGAVLTFLTVSFSSWRVSYLNIVRAIRDIPEPANRRMGWRGLAAWCLALVFGALMVWSGVSGNQAFPFMLGFTLVFCGVAVLATHFGAPARPSYTGMGLALLLFWGLAAGDRLEPIFGRLEGDIEMFFLSGVAMVTASTFVIIYNSDVFLAAVSRLGGAFGSVLPSLRTAIAYPMANRFRTGMTLAMISLVVFSLTMMSTMNLNYDKLFLNDESRGGWDIQVIENPNNPLPGLRAALTAQGAQDVAGEIRAEGQILDAGYVSTTEVNQGDSDAWDDYPVRGMTDEFIDNGRLPLQMTANGYDDAESVLAALKSEPDVAVIDGFTIEGGFGPSEFSLQGTFTGDQFEAPVIRVRNASSGATRDVRIIGVIAFGASSNFYGIYLGADAWADVFGEPDLTIHYAALQDPARARDVAREIESALVTSGAQADSLQQLADENNALSRGFLYLMQAFMGLGLLVGIAAVGVIAFRTVVERRQQIGMLRAIGYKKNQVALSFLLESSFVTFLGIASGISLGLWLAWFLVTGDDFPAEGQRFYVPWLEIALVGAFTMLASTLMTWIPSRQAASVPTAEALRYE